MPSIADVVERYGKQKYLAASLFFFLIADAFFPGNRLLSSSVLSLMIITGPLATSRRPNVRRGTIALAVLMVGAGYLASLGQQPVVGSGEFRSFELAAAVFGALFFFALIYLISRSLLFEQTRVTGETLWAAINVYVLMGMLFAYLYALLSIVEPGALGGGLLEAKEADVGQTYLYYSFVTMTTLGYGDITPKIQVAGTLAYLQALIGQLYVAILIARLVSLYGASPK